MNDIGKDKEVIYILNNPIIKKLIKESYFTHTQLQILLDYIYRKERKIPISTKKDEVILYNKKIKRGAYYRTLNKSKNKIYKSIITMILITSLGVISHHDITSLLNKTSSLDIDIENLEIYENLIKKLKQLF